MLLVYPQSRNVNKEELFFLRCVYLILHKIPAERC